MRPDLKTSIRLALSLTALAPYLAAHASTAPEATEFDELSRITVTATKQATEVVDVPAAVTVIEREQMDRELVQDIRDLVRYEPGVSVTSGFGRFGIGDFRIRGLEANRVLIETDGIAVSDDFSIGSFASNNRNFVDPMMLKSVEIVRGPGSSLYGSDALGGVVSFVTRDPLDLVAEGEQRHLGARVGYSSDDDSAHVAASWAQLGERWSGLLMVNHREGSELENQGDVDSVGSTRTQANPADTESNNLLAKLLFAPNADVRWRLALDANESSALTDVLSGETTRATLRVREMDGDDHQTRARLSLGQEVDALDSLFADSLHWQVYRQDSETTQRTREDRVSLSGGNEINPTLREREFNFDQRVTGGEFTASKSLRTGGWTHRLTWGTEATRTEVHQKRDGRATNLTTGMVTSTILPDVFPVRDFPISTTTELAAYLQDEIISEDGRWRFVPALRYDHYDLDPTVDTIFAQDNPGIEPSGITRDRVSPKLGLVWQWSDAFSLFGGYSAGFRSPPYNDVNLGFTNFQFGYTAIPNPDLKPETSDGFELGLRWQDTNVYASLSTYLNRYDDFIESLIAVDVDPQTGLLIFQSRNVAEAEIKGVELKAGLSLAAFNPAWDAWEVRFAAASSRGDDVTADVPLTSVDPATATLGLMYRHETWGAELVGRFAERKDRLPPVATTTGDADAFVAPGYGVLDLLFDTRLGEHASLNFGIFNLLDRKYWEWSATPNVVASSAVLDRYTAPGRYFSAQVDLHW